MIGLKETTKWEEVDGKVKNNNYFLNKAGNLVAYIKESTGELVKFKKPLKEFSKSRRTFKKVEVDISTSLDV